MKTSRPFFFLFLIFLFVIPATVLSQESSSESEAPDTVEYLVTAETANLRSQPNTNSIIVGAVSKGENVLIYDEEPESSGWFRIYRKDEADAYIADFLVERAPTRFYPVEQEPIITASGRGKSITDVYDIPKGVYRIDAVVEDRSFILKTVVVAGDCRDRSLLNELNFDVSKLILSALFISQGCSILFETDNVDRNWTIEIRDLLDMDFLTQTTVEIENETSISGIGKALTMPTLLPEGIWTISASVQDNAFILTAHPLGDCEEKSVLNELDFDVKVLEASAVYRSSNCIIWWETSNVDNAWQITFKKVR